MKFETANFKLTTEMIKILGGDEKSEDYSLYVLQTIKGFLAVREKARLIIDSIKCIVYSGLECIKPDSLNNLQKRFRLDLNTSDAAKYMKDLIKDSHNKLSTRM